MQLSYSSVFSRALILAIWTNALRSSPHQMTYHKCALPEKCPYQIPSRRFNPYWCEDYVTIYTNKALNSKANNSHCKRLNYRTTTHLGNPHFKPLDISHILYQKSPTYATMALLRSRQKWQSFQPNSESDSEENIRQFLSRSCSTWQNLSLFDVIRAKLISLLFYGPNTNLVPSQIPKCTFSVFTFSIHS